MLKSIFNYATAVGVHIAVATISSYTMGGSTPLTAGLFSVTCGALATVFGAIAGHRIANGPASPEQGQRLAMILGWTGYIAGSVAGFYAGHP